MAKARTTVEVDLPPYTNPRTQWRRLIYAAASHAMRAKGVSYKNASGLELVVQLRLNEFQLPLHDVDNLSVGGSW